MKSVAILVFPGVQSLDVAGPLDAFAEANSFIPAEAGYRITTVAPVSGVFQASNGMPLAADHLFSDAPHGFDLLLVPGGPNVPAAPRDETICAWLKREATVAQRYGSVCTGAFLLGRAGLLDGRSVTTHWSNAAPTRAVPQG